MVIKAKRDPDFWGNMLLEQKRLESFMFSLKEAGTNVYTVLNDSAEKLGVGQDFYFYFDALFSDFVDLFKTGKITGNQMTLSILKDVSVKFPGVVSSAMEHFEKVVPKNVKKIEYIKKKNLGPKT